MRKEVLLVFVLLLVCSLVFVSAQSVDSGGGGPGLISWLKSLFGSDVNPGSHDDGSSLLGPGEPYDWVLIGSGSPSNPSIPDSGSRFGQALKVSGDVAIVGGALSNVLGSNLGVAEIYRFNYLGGFWEPEAAFTSSDVLAFDYFGAAVDIDGDVAVVGAEGRDDGGLSYSGAVYVYRYNGVNWVEEQKLSPPDPQTYARFGSAVSVYGDYITVASKNYDYSGLVDTGIVYLYKYNGVSWVEQGSIIPSDISIGDFFGTGLDMGDGVMAIGSPQDDDSASDSGAVYVYRLNSGAWNFERKLKASDAGFTDHFGNEVSVKGNNILVGSPQDDDLGTDSGAAYLFEFDGSQWFKKQKLLISDGVAGDTVGNSLSLSNDYLVIGAEKKSYFDGTSDLANAGAVYLFKYDSIGDSWNEESILREEVIKQDNNFGIAVSVDGEHMFIGGDQKNLFTAKAYHYRHISLCENGVQDGDETGVDCGGSCTRTCLPPSNWVEKQKISSNPLYNVIQFGHDVLLGKGHLYASGPFAGPYGAKSFELFYNGSSWVQYREFSPQSAAAGQDLYGYSIDSMQGYLAFGAYSDRTLGNNVGKVYIYVPGDSGWVLSQELFPSDPQDYMSYGALVRFYGGRLYVSAPSYSDSSSANLGKIYVYALNDGVWTEVQTLKPEDGVQTAHFGDEFEFLGNLLAVGVSNSDEACATSVSCTSDIQCNSGEYCMTGLGECVRDPCSSGSVYLYEDVNGVWNFRGKIYSSDAAEMDAFGAKIAMDGDLLVVSATGDDDRFSNSGSAYVFRKDANGNYVQEQKLAASDKQDRDFDYGTSISISGDRIAIGAAYYHADGLFKEGKVYIYRYHEGEWIEEKILTASDPTGRSEFGNVVSLNGGQLFVGARAKDYPGGVDDAGAVYYFEDTYAVSCTLDSDCNDGEVCNGVETCQSGKCVAEGGMSCSTFGACFSDLDCNDGLYCNGVETCDLGTGACVSGTPVDCGTGTCDEVNNVCVSPSCNTDADTNCDGTVSCGELNGYIGKFVDGDSGVDLPRVSSAIVAHLADPVC